MKNFVLILFCFGLVGLGFCKSACTKKDIDKIIKCYKDKYVDLSAPFAYFGLALSVLMRNTTKEYWQPACDTKKVLNNCIGNVRIQKCFNVKDLTRLPAPDNSSTTKQFISKIVTASFIETDHICDKLFKFSDKDYNCYNKVTPIISATCGPKPVDESCESASKFRTCMTQTTYKHCGKTVGCFEQKNDQYNLCFAPLTCKFCNNLNVANNSIDGLCGDDNNIGKVGKIAVGKNLLGINLRQLLETKKIGENKQN